MDTGELPDPMITARKRSLRMLCFYTCLSVILFTGRGCLPQCMLGYPPEETPPGADPPSAEHAGEIRSTRGRYASYWNAICLEKIPKR